MKYWLMKTEPSTFSVDDLEKAPRRTTAWDGVRNYQARNMMRDEFAIGDLALLYHSSCDVPGAGAVVKVVKAGYPDATAQDPSHDHYDPKASAQDPRWYMVDIRLEQRLPRVVTLDEMRAHAGSALAGMLLLRAGNRLSVTPVERAHFEFIVSLA